MKHRLLLPIVALGFAPLASLNAQTSAAPAHQHAPGFHKRPGIAKHHTRQRLTVLSEGERAELKTARKSIKGNPQLVAARQAVDAAPNKEAKRAAREEAHQVRRNLLLEADPSLSAVFEKIDAARDTKKTRG